MTERDHHPDLAPGVLPLACRPIADAIGAVIDEPKAALLDGRHAGALRGLLEKCGVLVFPSVDFSHDEHVAFTSTLGEYVTDNADGSATDISIDPAGGSVARYTEASFFWHFDGYMNTVPILGSVMCCIRPAPVGGNTEFCNTYAAWEALPDDRKAAIEGLFAVHSLAGAQKSVEPEPSYATFQEWRKIKHNSLPLVWTHKSGRKSLVIGNTATGVVGMDPLESLDLLTYLRDWATQDRFCMSHSWNAGDAVLWDNTGTLHRATPYAKDSNRLMRRTKLAGEEPFSA